jgi:GrpB-like predicted nucleotidyltransferase (UPF0157 family)
MSRDARPVEIRDYDPTWPLRFTELAARILTGIGGSALRAEHVGSTAVTGLAGKPVIDIDVVVATRGDIPEVIRRLGTLGYVHEGDLGIPGREAFRGMPGEPRHHLYVVVEGSHELTRHLRFRDALRADPAVRDRYADLKRSAAARHGNDRAAYAQAKSAFIEAVLAHAAATAGRGV